MISAGTGRRLTLRLPPDTNQERLGRVLRDECRVESYSLDHRTLLRLRYHLHHTGYRHIRATLDAAGIRTRLRFCDTLIRPLLDLAEENLQQQQQLASWKGDLHNAYVMFKTQPSTHKPNVHHWQRHKQARKGDSS